MSTRRVTLSHRLPPEVKTPSRSFSPPDSETYKWWLLANVMIGTFMAVLDATIVNVGLPKIMASFGVGIDKIEWVITAYMLAMAVMLPASAWLADKYGYKRMYFLGMLAFTIRFFPFADFLPMKTCLSSHESYRDLGRRNIDANRNGHYYTMSFRPSSVV